MEGLQQRNDEPLLTKDNKCTYREALYWIQKVNTRGSSANGLPRELAKRIVDYLVIERVNPTQVQVVDCSSHDRTHPLPCCLQDDEETWWLSEHGSMPQGRGREWLQFTLGPRLRRLTAILLKIPPLPQGPLSVREFCIEAYSNEQGWHSVSPTFVVPNRIRWQHFMLDEPADVTQVRMVCLSNQVANFMQEEELSLAQVRQLESVGFYSIRFE